MTQNTVQSTYGRRMPHGTAGMAADMTGWDADSRICETAAGIGFGLAVSQGVGDNGAVLGGNQFVGISVRDITLAHATADKYAQYDNMGVLFAGDVWVTVASGDVEAGEIAKYDTTTGAISSASGTTIAGARFMTSAATGELAILRLTGAQDTTT